MKILLCERNLTGHRKLYMEWLTKVPEIEFYILAPENIGMDCTHFIQYKASDNLKTLKEYLKWINQIKDVVKKEKIDAVHILDGDSIMRFFGLGLHHLGARKIVITYHHFFPGLTRRMSYCLMNRSRKTVCVAHTASVQRELQMLGIKNVARCEYPAFYFDSISQRVSSECKAAFGLPEDVPTIGIIGGMNSYKNIIPFLEAMADCKQNFHLLICGKESSVTEKQIKEAILPYKDKVKLVIRQLSENEYEQAIAASDIVYCVYGHEFDGASGPLTDGVCAQKMILSCKHGSLGEIVSENLLGLTAECNDRAEVIMQTELALCRSKIFRYGEAANRYRMQIQPEYFILAYKRVYSKR